MVREPKFKFIFPRKAKAPQTATRKLIDQTLGKPIEVHRVRKADVEKNELNTTWIPHFDHPNMPPEMVQGIAKTMLPGALRISTDGAMDVLPTWNELLPDMKFTDIETFLTDVFGEKSHKR